MPPSRPLPRGPFATAPPEAWEPLLRLRRFATRPLDRFLGIQAASGILLLLAAGLALVWANSRWSGSYVGLWQTTLRLQVGAIVVAKPLLWIVNDVLMVIFFFVIGLEIRREIHNGELSEWRRALLPGAAALGGMVVPAGIFLLLAGGGEARVGWGVPMATDIAFAVGVLTLLGSRVPSQLRVLLLALAVIDDLGAILVIAIFYSPGIVAAGVGIAAIGVACVLALQRLGVRHKGVYALPAFAVWGGIYYAGIHPTIAGVIVGLVTPVRAWLGPSGFVQSLRAELGNLSKPSDGALATHEIAAAMSRVDDARREALSPVDALIEALHPWVAFGIMPLFALANAGVALSGGGLDRAAWSAAMAVFAALVVGKPLGVLSACWLSVRLGVARLPPGVTTRPLLVLGVVAGIGFTMSIFIAGLAFVDAAQLTAAKLGVLAASACAMVLGLALGFLLLEAPREELSAPEAAAGGTSLESLGEYDDLEDELRT